VEYLHLPLQSGSDRVLERMNRGYTRARYLELIDELVETVPDLALSTDLIVGFPGETEADFEETVTAVERVRYDNVFAFRYSRRPGTPAADRAEQVPGEVKARRNSRILEVAERVGAERRHALEGRVMPVLVDGRSRKDPHEVTGRTRCNRVVNFDAHGRELMGRTVPVLVTRALLPARAGGLAAPGGAVAPPAASRGGGTAMWLEMTVKGLALDPLSNMPIIILRDEEEKRSLPIWVGLFEANAIALELEKIPTPRPMTHDLIKNILESVDARVIKVEVNDLRENTFFAVIHLQLGS